MPEQQKLHYNAVDEKTKLLLMQYLTEHKVDIQIEAGPSRFKAVTQPQAYSKICVVGNTTLFKGEKVLGVYFKRDNVLYYFKTGYAARANVILLSYPAQVLKIQRRDNYRVLIPSNLAQTAVIAEHPQMKALIDQLSLSGCQVSIITSAATLFRVGETFTIKISLLDLNERSLKCQVRHGRFFQESKLRLILGVQFVQPSAADLADLQNLIGKLDRLNRHVD